MNKEYHDKYCEFKWNKGMIERDVSCNCIGRRDAYKDNELYRRGFHDGASTMGDRIKNQGLRHVFEMQNLRTKFKERLKAATHKAFVNGLDKGQKSMKEE